MTQKEGKRHESCGIREGSIQYVVADHPVDFAILDGDPEKMSDDQMLSIAIDSRTGKKNWCPTVRSVDEVNPDRVTKVFDESEAHQAKLDERKHECNKSE